MTDAIKLTEALTSTDPADIAVLVEKLVTLYSSFQKSRNPIYPQKAVLQYLADLCRPSAALPCCVRTLSLATLALFCESSRDYDHVLVKKNLITFGIAQVLVDSLSSADYAAVMNGEDGAECRERLDELEHSSFLLLSLADVIWPAESNLVLTKLVKLCLDLCSPSGKLFGYSHATRVLMRELMCGKELVAYAGPVSLDPTPKERELFEHCFGYRMACLGHCKVDIYSSSNTCGQDMMLSDMLALSGGAWSSRQLLSSSNAVDSDTDVSRDGKDWYTVLVGDLVCGPHFLAQVTEQSKSSQLANIEEILRTSPPVTLKTPLGIGSLATAFGSVGIGVNTNSQSGFYRCQVLKELAAGTSGACYLVLAIDYGFVRSVAASHLYAPCPSLTHLRPSVSLCSLEGIGPAPVSQAVICHAIHILRILCRGNHSVGEAIVKGCDREGLDVLLHLVEECPLADVCSDAVLVIAELARDSRIRHSSMMTAASKDVTAGSAITGRLIGSCKKFRQLGWSSTLASTLLAIANIVCDNEAAINTLSQELPFLIELSRTKPADSEEGGGCVRKHALLCLRNFVGNVPIPATPPPTAMPVTSAARVSMPPAPLNAGEPQLSSSLSPAARSSGVGGCWKRHTVAVTHLPLEEEAAMVADESNGINAASLLCNTSKCEPYVDDLSVNSDRFYVKGHSSGMSLGDVCELSAVTDVSKINSNCVARTICAFLNAGQGGSLFFGISHSGVVHGVRINRAQRDEFRLGVDNLMTRMSVLHTLVVVKLYAVVLPEGHHMNSTRTCIPETYIVEIAVPSTRGQLYSVSGQNGSKTPYTRKGAQTVKASAQDVREIAVRHYEQSYIEQIAHLRREIRRTTTRGQTSQGI